MTDPAHVDVLAPGLLTTVQDNGRRGWRRFGVGTAGALDPWSHALANLLVGNGVHCATLEISLTGPTLRFAAATRVALCGARIDAEMDGHALPMARPLDMPAGSVLRLGACHDGARSWLAVAGGFALAPVLGSRATDLRGGFGGWQGRALRRGDRFPLAASTSVPGSAARIARHPERVQVARWWVNLACDERPYNLVRVLPGSDTPAPAGALFARRWSVQAASNRQGLRLQGEPLHVADAQERSSEPVLPGTIQLPADGQPIVLLADAQTHGGYPRIGHVIRADWPKLAQLGPGAGLVFEPVDAAQAWQALQRQHQRLARLQLAIAAQRG